MGDECRCGGHCEIQSPAVGLWSWRCGFAAAAAAAAALEQAACADASVARPVVSAVAAISVRMMPDISHMLLRDNYMDWWW